MDEQEKKCSHEGCDSPGKCETCGGCEVHCKCNSEDPDNPSEASVETSA